MRFRFACERSVSVAALLLAAVVVHQDLEAQPYPNKPVRLIVPSAPGGSMDIVARILAAQLTERLGTTVIVDSRGGGAGIIGTQIAAQSNPDGYTLLVVSNSFSANRALYKLPYDSDKDFTPVAMIGSGPNVLAVHPGLPVKSVSDLIALCKQRPGQLNYATPAAGSFQNLASVMFKMMTHIDIVAVPFKGGGPATMSVMAGHTQMTFGSLIQTLSFIRADKLRALGTGALKRAAVLPNVPTIAESGVPGYEANIWWGIVAPARTPAGIVGRLHQESTAALKSAEVQKLFNAQAAQAVSMTPAEFGTFVTAETTKWTRVIKEAGIRAE